MSQQQQVIRLVALHHVFWEHELERASDDELEDCRFFRQQTRDELAALKRGGVKESAEARPVPSETADKPAERRFSTQPPKKVLVRAAGGSRPPLKVPLTPR